MALRIWFCVALLASGALAAQAQEPALANRLTSLARSHHGKVAIAVKNLQTGECFYLNENEPMPTASLIKLAVMVEVFQQAADGKLKLSDPVALRQEDKVPGSGVLTDHFTPGLTMPLRDAVSLMIGLSDNTATNLVLDKIGIAATAKRMESLGFPNTKIHSKVFRGSTSVFPERSKQFGLGSTTAREMVELLERLFQGKVVDAQSCKEMLEMLRKCSDHEKFPRFLPEDVKVAHKTGSLSEVRTDAGIIYLPGGPVALCVLTAANKDHRWVVDNEGNVLCAKVAQEVAEHYRSRSPKVAVTPQK
jgi:beta-lactamase class A